MMFDRCTRAHDIALCLYMNGLVQLLHVFKVQGLFPCSFDYFFACSGMKGLIILCT